MNKILDWFYQDGGYIAIIRRLCGVWLLGMMPAHLSKTLLIPPYQVPSWRFGTNLLEMPKPPLAVDVILYVAYAVCALAMVFGKKHKAFIAIPAGILAYFSTREYLSCADNYVPLMFLYLVCLLFYKEPLSPARRLIQLVTSIMYFFTAVQKINPEFINGWSMYIVFHDGSHLRPFLQPILNALPITVQLCGILGIIVIATEFFLSIGLMCGPTRKLALRLGILFHLSLLLFIEYVDIFQWIMFTAYLAFFEKKPGPTAEAVENAKPKAGKLEIACLTSYVLILLWMPLRFYVLTDRPLDSMLFADRTPWAWSMYVWGEKAKSLKVTYHTAEDKWLELQQTGRMDRTVGDNEMVALGRYVLHTHPEADSVLVDAKIDINNGHWLMSKVLKLTRDGAGYKADLTVTNQRDKRIWR